MRYLDYKIANRMEDIERINNGFFSYPQSLTVYPSEVCNLKCAGCNSQGIHKKDGFMDFNLFKTIIDDFRGKAVAFEGGGEPMLHPQIDYMIGYCVGKELKVGIITNGTIYKEEMLWADWVRISIPNPNLVPKIVEKNIKKLMRERINTRIGIKLLRSKLCLDPMITLPSDYVQIKDLRNHKNSLKQNPKYIKPCGLTSLRAVVDYDGTFYPCPFFYAQTKTAIGKGLLSELWGTPAHKKAIKNIKNCNEYDCPMLDIDWEEIKKADLNFL